MKICKKCSKTEAEVTFPKRKYTCNPCINAKRREKYAVIGISEEQRLKKNASTKTWRDANKDKTRKISSTWYQEHKDYRREYLANWRARNIDKVKPARDEYNRAYRVSNKYRITEYSRKYYSENTAICNKRSKLYRENNSEKYHLVKRNWYKKYPDKGRAIRAKRRAKLQGNGGSYTAEEWQNILALYDYRCLACGTNKNICADHVLPLSKGGTSYIYNIQPLCLQCNSRKLAKHIDYRPL